MHENNNNKIQNSSGYNKTVSFINIYITNLKKKPYNDLLNCMNKNKKFF